jgi:hypothetical protein
MEMEHKELSKKEGWKHLSKVGNAFISKNDDLLINPFSNRGLRFRCLLLNKESIYLYLTIEEIEKNIDIDPTPKEIYFYGVYTQSNVCQINIHQVCAFCNIKQVQVTKEFNSIYRSITNRLLGDKINSDNFIESFYPNGREKGDAIRSLFAPGKLYCFTPLSFSYNKYERG